MTFDNRCLNKNMFLKFQAPRKLNLHAQVVEQLLTLGLSPPSTAADIPKVLEDLQEKKVGTLTNYYQLNHLKATCVLLSGLISKSIVESSL